MKWIIVFYQIIVALPEGEIVFSGLSLGNKFVKTELNLAYSYDSKDECEKKLVSFKLGVTTVLTGRLYFIAKSKSL